MEVCSEIKWNNLLIPAATWKNVQGTVLRERMLIPKVQMLWVALLQHSLKDNCADVEDVAEARAGVTGL